MIFDQKKGPIFIQVAEYIESNIVSGKVLLGEKLLSAREFGVTYNLNPNTVVKAYQKLEEYGLTENKRGLGTFVKEDIDLEKLRNKKTRELIEDTREKLNWYGISDEKFLSYFERKF